MIFPEKSLFISDMAAAAIRMTGLPLRACGWNTVFGRVADRMSEGWPIYAINEYWIFGIIHINVF